MTVEQIRADLDRCRRLPLGRAKAQRLESLAEQAEQAADRRLEGEVLLALSSAYEYTSEREQLPVVFGRLLRLLDQFPAETADLSLDIHWMLKWMTSGLYENPAVPLATVYRWLDEFGSRYRQRGYSPRPVLARRSGLARLLGDVATASALMEESIAAPRDQMADCQACERGDWGDWRVAAGDDAGALEHWAPVLGGALRCQEEPHRTLAKALLPLLRAGRSEEARGAFLRGYPMVRRDLSLISQVGRHIEFCALTGNEPRGLEILAEHADWLTDAQLDADSRLSFIGGVAVLLRRLSALGHGALSAGTGTVDSVLATLEDEIRDLCARYDERNGTTAVSERVAARLAQQPLLDFLPLGLPARLPAPPAHPAAMPAPTGPAAMPASAGPAAMPAPAGPAATLEELIERARRLAADRHPDAPLAWARVAAADADLPADVAAQVARFSAGELLASDPAAAEKALLETAGLFAALGDLDGELETRASAALALTLSGGNAAAREAITAVTGQAEAAFAAGKLTPRHYLNVRVTGHMIAAQPLGTTADRAPADVAALVAGLDATRAAAVRLGQPHHAGRCHDLLARASFWRGDTDGMVAHLTAARESYLAAAQPWFAAQPEAALAEFALRSGDPRAAEPHARDALAHGAGFDPRQTAQLSSLLAEVLSRQPDKAAEFAAASLAAAARWDGISEPDTLHNTFNAARAYARLDRHGEAAALFAEAMPRVEVPYAPTGVAMTREEYGRSLRSLGRHREAAEQFVAAARLVDGDPENVAAHAFLAAAAAEELQSSGQRAAALPAFQRAAELFGGLGDTVSRVRCLRSAAWLEFWSGETRDAERAGVATMRSVLAELQSLTAADSSAELAAELDNTRKQFDEMLEEAATAPGGEE